jgi:hypothetical protein
MKSVIRVLYFTMATVLALPILSSSSIVNYRGLKNGLNCVVQSLSGDVYVIQYGECTVPAKGNNIKLSVLLGDLNRFASIPRGFILGCSGYEIENIQRSVESDAKLIHIVAMKEIFDLSEIGTTIGTLGGSCYVVENIQNLDSIGMVLITIAATS